MMEKITVIILSYNNYNYIFECIQSVLKQTYSNIEIVISDDGSNEFSQNEIKEFIYKNNKGNITSLVLNINKKNIGVVKNYNKAIKLSKGEYFFYLAADDIFYDEKVLDDVVRYFKTTGNIIFTGFKDVYNENMDKYLKTLPRENEVEFLKLNNPQIIYEKLCLGSFISGSNTPFSKKFLMKYGLLDEEYQYLEDYPRYLKVTKAGCNIGFIERKLIKYRLGGVTTNGQINDFLRKDLSLVAEKEKKDFILKNYNLEWFNKKRIIGWGTGDCFKECYKQENFKVEYLVDSNKSIQGAVTEGAIIKSPKSLMNECTNDEIFIFVFSYSNYFDIAKELDKIGFVEKKNYYLCTPEILKVLGEN